MESLADSHSSLLTSESSPWQSKRRRASTFHEGASFHETRSTTISSEDNKSEPSESASFPLPPPCTCPYFGEKQSDKSPLPTPAEVKIVPSDTLQVSGKLTLDVEKPVSPSISPIKKSSLVRSRGSSGDSSPNNVMVTWETRRSHRRGNAKILLHKLNTDKTYFRYRFQFWQHPHHSGEQLEFGHPTHPFAAPSFGHPQAERPRRRPHRQEQEPVFALSAAALQLQQRHHQHGEEYPFPPQQELQRDIQELLSTRQDNQARAESDQGAGGGVLHLRHPVGALLHPQPATHLLFGVRQEPGQLGGATGDVVGVRQFHGEPHLLHHIQQGVPAGLQEGATLQVQEDHVEAAQVTGEGEENQETTSGCELVKCNVISL